jgi:hypothetical protein
MINAPYHKNGADFLVIGDKIGSGSKISYCLVPKDFYISKFMFKHILTDFYIVNRC